jgi:F-type H+-transporting ATPase subunit gamma
MTFLHDKVETEYPNAKIHVIPVGKRTCLFFKRQKYDVIREYSGIFAALNFKYAKEIGNEVVSAFINEEIDKVYIFFNEFKNIMIQRPATVTLLPIEQTEVKDASNKNFQIDYIFEPSEKEILDDLLPKHMDIQIWRTLLESFASEQAARMMAMENATKNANDLIKHLELVFNKARQAAITKEMLEIVSGADALKKA